MRAILKWLLDAPKGYRRLGTGQIVREEPKVRGKAARKAEKRARQAARGRA